MLHVHKMDGDDENNVSFVDDGNDVAKSLSRDIQYAEDTLWNMNL